MIRAPYKTRMRLRQDSDEETEVQWFRCQPGAKIYPGYTLFGSGNWAIDRTEWNGPGEVLGAPRPFTKKQPLSLGRIGLSWCGSHYAIEHGATGSMTPLPKRTDGLAKCCPGRIAPVGLSVTPLRIITKCGQYRDPPAAFSITFAPGSTFQPDDCTVDLFSPCAWRGVGNITPGIGVYTSYEFRLSVGFLDYFELRFFGIFFGIPHQLAQWSSVGVPDGGGPFTMIGPSGWPQATVDRV